MALQSKKIEHPLWVPHTLIMLSTNTPPKEQRKKNQDENGSVSDK
jgi:hypothetical protein